MTPSGFATRRTDSRTRWTTTATETATAESTEPSTETPTSESYTVEMAPMGTVAFDGAPDSWMAYFSTYGDMAIALGQADGMAGLVFTENWPRSFYDDLPGVDVSFDDVPQLMGDSGMDKEAFYELDADVHLFDPNFIQLLAEDWDDDDFDEVRTEIGPIVGNSIRRRGADWHDYRYYSLYDAFETVAAVVQERERFEAIKSMHDDLVAEVQSRLPAPDDRPNAALVFAGEQPEEFTPYRLSGNGANKEQFHTLGLSDAFAGTGVDGLSTTDTGTIDYETLLEIDPDSLLLRYHRTGKRRSEFEDSVLAFMEDHPVGSQLTAVQDGNVFRGGPIYAGPLHNLFMIERYATGYFPERFDEDELFDRDRLARIVTEGVDDVEETSG